MAHPPICRSTETTGNEESQQYNPELRYEALLLTHRRALEQQRQQQTDEGNSSNIDNVMLHYHVSMLSLIEVSSLLEPDEEVAQATRVALNSIRLRERYDQDIDVIHRASASSSSDCDKVETLRHVQQMVSQWESQNDGEDVVDRFFACYPECALYDKPGIEKEEEEEAQHDENVDDSSTCCSSDVEIIEPNKDKAHKLKLKSSDSDRSTEQDAKSANLQAATVEQERTVPTTTHVVNHSNAVSPSSSSLFQQQNFAFPYRASPPSHFHQPQEAGRLIAIHQQQEPQQSDAWEQYGNITQQQQQNQYPSSNPQFVQHKYQSYTTNNLYDTSTANPYSHQPLAAPQQQQQYRQTPQHANPFQTAKEYSRRFPETNNNNGSDPRAQGNNHQDYYYQQQQPQQYYPLFHPQQPQEQEFQSRQPTVRGGPMLSAGLKRKFQPPKRTAVASSSAGSAGGGSVSAGAF